MFQPIQSPAIHAVDVNAAPSLWNPARRQWRSCIAEVMRRMDADRTLMYVRIGQVVAYATPETRAKGYSIDAGIPPA